MFTLLTVLLHHSNTLLVVYYGFSGVLSLVLLVAAARFSTSSQEPQRAQGGREDQIMSRLAVSIIVPAHNEEAVIVSSVRTLRQLDYPSFEIVVVNDGSQDGTLQVLKAEFDLAPVNDATEAKIRCGKTYQMYRSRMDQRLLVIDKESRGSKADALNSGLNAAIYPYICVVDVDSVLEPDALMKIMRPIAENPELVVASSGVILVGNGLKLRDSQIVGHCLPDAWLESIQLVEYRRAFLVERLAWSSRNMLMIISGAFGVFRKDLVSQLGGYRSETVGEDLDLAVRMHRYLLERNIEYKIALVPHPGCWTEAPSSHACLGKQRSRWHRGLLDVLLNNRDMIFNPRYGKVGMLAIPYLWIYELFSPVLELATWVSILAAGILGILNWRRTGEVLIMGMLLSALLSICSMLLGLRITARGNTIQEIIRLVACCFIEQLYYRQMHVIWRLRGFWHYLCGDVSWRSPQRRGFQCCPEPLKVIDISRVNAHHSENTPCGQLALS